MRTLKFLLRKEFRQIFRNKSLLPILFILPMIQLLIMPMAANFDVRYINIAIADKDRSTTSQQLIAKIGSSGYFHIVDYSASYEQAFRSVEREKADIILEIPVGFGRNLVKEGSQKVFLAADAINGIKGGLGSSYLTSVLTDFNNEWRIRWVQPQKLNTPADASPAQPAMASIAVEPVNWFNPTMNYQFFMVPGILVILVTMVGGFIAALNIVKEKEIGTIEQINVTPIKKWQFIAGKLIP